MAGQEVNIVNISDSALARLFARFRQEVQGSGNASVLSTQPTVAEVRKERKQRQESHRLTAREIQLQKEEIKNRKNLNKINRDLQLLLKRGNKGFDELYVQMDRSSQVFEDIIHSTTNLNAVSTKAAKAFSKNFEKMGVVFNSLDDVMTARAELERLNSKEFRAAVNEYVSGRKKFKELFSEFNDLTIFTDWKKINKQNRREFHQELLQYVSERNDAMAKSTMALNEHRTSMNAMTQSLGNFSKRLLDTDVQLFNLSQSLTRMFHETGRVVESTAILSSDFGAFSPWIQSLIQGVSVDDFLAINKQNRETIMAASSYEEWLNKLSSSSQSMLKFTGDQTKATEQAARAFTIMSKSGISPVTAELSDITGSFRDLTAMSGLTSDQLLEVTQELLNTPMTLSKLNAASEAERRAIVQSTTERMKEVRMMGYSIEQWKRMNDTLENRLKAPFKERMKSAAQGRAAFAAMGKAAEGEEFMRLTMMGRRAGPAEKKRLAELGGILKTEMDKAATATGPGGMPAFGREALFDTLISKTGMEDIAGPDSPFNKQLAENRKVLESQLKSLRTASDSLLPDIKGFLDKIVNILSSSFAQVLTSLGVLLGKSLAIPIGITAFNTSLMVKQMTGKGTFGNLAEMFGIGKGKDDIHGPPKPGSKSKLGKLGKFAGKGGILGAVLGGVGLLSLWSDTAEAQASGQMSQKEVAQARGGGIGAATGGIAGALAGGAAGALAGSVIPGIGTAVGGLIGFAGSLIGGMLGSNLGESVGRSVGDAVTDTMPSKQITELTEKSSEQATTFSANMNKLTNTFESMAFNIKELVLLNKELITLTDRQLQHMYEVDARALEQMGKATKREKIDRFSRR